MNQVRSIGKSQTVELAILSNTVTQFPFLDNETMLDDKTITAISIINDSAGKSPSGRFILPAAEIAKGYLTLMDSDKKSSNRQLPMELFLRQDGSIIFFKPFKFNLRNTYVDLPQIGLVGIPAGPPAGFAILFTFFYE